MKNNKEFKRLQCDLSADVFNKLKESAQQSKLTIGKHLEKVLSSIDASFANRSVISFESAKIAKENENKDLSSKQMSQHGEKRRESHSRNLVFTKKLDLPWWNKIFR